MSQKTISRKAFGRSVWSVTLSAALLAACGGGTVDTANTATNGGQSATASTATTGTAPEQANAATAAGAASEPGWTYCADEGGTCTFAGTRMVRYGANGTYAYKTGTNSIGCNNTVFGDPNRGVKKYCWISTSPTPYMQDATQYTLAFRDEFDGAALDANKWNTRIWYDQESTVNNYGVENGYLKIWPQPDANGVVTRRILTTKGKFEMSYGFFEMEAKLPVGDGPWPAFWLLNSDNPDAGEPEIDIMEAYPGDKSGYWADPSNQHAVAYNLSWYQIGNGTQDADGNDTPRDSVQYYTGDILSSGFHKYGLKWEPNKLSYYFDGKLVYTASIPMSKKMYILLDMQYDGSQSPSGDVDETTPLGKSNSFAINYVRAWKLK